MNYKKYSKLVAFICFFTLNVSAAEYNTSEQMSREDHQKVRQLSVKHFNCMTEFAISKIETQTDPRVIADHAMKECAPILESLYSMLLESNYSPEAIQRFVSHISNRSANKVLSKLMMYMASRRN